MPVEFSNNAHDDLLERALAVERITHAFARNADHADIEIAVDEGITTLIEARQKGESIESSLAYVCEIARRFLVKVLRKKKHEGPMNEVMREPDAHDGTEASIEARDMVRKIYARMPADYCEVLRLDSEGYEIKEIAEMMGRSKDATYKLKERAEKRFYEVGIKLGCSPSTTRPSKAKINRKILKSSVEFRGGSGTIR